MRIKKRTYDISTGNFRPNRNSKLVCAVLLCRTHCSCPMKVDLGNNNTQIFFQGLWYYDDLVRTPEGWKIKERYEDGYWNYNVPQDFKF